MTGSTVPLHAKDKRYGVICNDTVSLYGNKLYASIFRLLKGSPILKQAFFNI